MPSNPGLVEDASIVLPVITRSAHIGTTSVAFDVIVLGIKSDTATSNHRRLHHVLALSQHNHLQNARRWVDVVATSPPNGRRDPLSVSTNHHPRFVACGCHCRAAHGLSTSDLQSLFGPLMESLRSDLQEFFVSQLEEVVRPFRAEISTIKLWLARMAKHLERGGPPSEDHFTDLVGLFGPCSPVRQSVTPVFSTKNLVADELEFHTVLNHDSKGVATRKIDIEKQATEGPSVTSSIRASLVEVCTLADSLVCEDTCDQCRFHQWRDDHGEGCCGALDSLVATDRHPY